MERYPKDEKLTGIYVKRCKCGARPYYDRIVGIAQWIACRCGRVGVSELHLSDAIKNWNHDKLNF